MFGLDLKNRIGMLGKKAKPVNKDELIKIAAEGQQLAALEELSAFQTFRSLVNMLRIRNWERARKDPQRRDEYVAKTAAYDELWEEFTHRIQLATSAEVKLSELAERKKDARTE